MKSFEIKKYQGQSDEVYLTIGKVAMSQEGKSYFDNYPVSTTENHTWYVLTKDNICGFVSVINLKTSFSIRNLYLSKECAHVETFKELMKVVMTDFKESPHEKAHCYAKKSDQKYWEQLGFTLAKDSSKWITMEKLK